MSAMLRPATCPAWAVRPALALLIAGAAPGLGGRPGTAWAQQAPACTAAQVGSVACVSGRLCECRFERGGSLTGLPNGHRWNCSILRPACGAAMAAPDVAAPPPLPVMPQLMLPAPQPQVGTPGPYGPGGWKQP